MFKLSKFNLGSSGIGKTMTIRNMLKRLTSQAYGLKSGSILDEVFNYSSRTSTTNNQAASMYDEDDSDNINAKKNKSDELSNITKKLNKNNFKIILDHKNRCCTKYDSI